MELSSPFGTEQNLSEFITPNLLPLLSLRFPGTLDLYSIGVIGDWLQEFHDIHAVKPPNKGHLGDEPYVLVERFSSSQLRKPLGCFSVATIVFKGSYNRFKRKPLEVFF